MIVTRPSKSPMIIALPNALTDNQAALLRGSAGTRRRRRGARGRHVRRARLNTLRQRRYFRRRCEEAHKRPRPRLDRGRRASRGESETMRGPARGPGGFVR